MGARLLVSAGEASGDLYAASLVEALKRREAGLRCFGCAGPRMRAAGVEAVVEAESLAVAGLVEVVRHIPRIHGEYRRLVRAAERERPQAAVLTDSPDFHLRLAKKLKKLGIPVIYLVAPQVWAWRRGRLRAMKRTIARLLCIFPFEPEFFARNGMPATYIGHPLTRLVRASAGRAELRRRYGLREGEPFVVLLPGSRAGEMERHLPHLLDAAERMRAARECRFALSLPAGFGARAALTNFEERFARSAIQVFEGETWDLIACADLAFAASGTVTVEAALLGTPMVTFYRVTALSWLLGKLLVRVPFYSMVNLLAGRMVAPELMQSEMTGERLAEEGLRLLGEAGASERARAGLREVAEALAGEGDPIETAASVVAGLLDVQRATACAVS